jgi:hypothetical protein
MVSLETLSTPVIHFPLAAHTTKLSSSINTSLQGERDRERERGERERDRERERGI